MYIYIHTLCIAISVIMAWYGNLVSWAFQECLFAMRTVVAFGGEQKGVAALPGGPGANATRGGASVKDDGWGLHG